ncbi:MAG: hypothetical protein NZM65_06460 [Flavobacteriales bacterium]|nr:hypothetical protein [Flavobacteriales bacterium]MDW8410316.1 hypothetical protein [Flavobacteriales bacterium]
MRTSIWGAGLLTAAMLASILSNHTRTDRGIFTHWNLEKVISWDNFGYYLWLPAWVIYRDPWLKEPWLKEIFEKYKPSDTPYQIFEGLEGKKVSIYHPGLALISLPAFAAGHLIALLTDQPTDGFSLPYRWSLLIWSVLLLGVAFYWILDTLVLYCRIYKPVLFLLLFVLSSNIPATIGLNGFGVHTAGFFLMALYVKLLHDALQHGWKGSATLALAIWVALALLTRPPVVLWAVLALPPWWEYARQHLVRRLVISFFFMIISMVPFLILLIYWKKATGYWTLNLHREVFDWWRPRWKWFLFSARNGWLVYSPVFFFLPIAWYFWWEARKSVALIGALVLFIIIWLHSAWECWHYGGGYGQRTMTDYYPIFIVSMAFAWNAAWQSGELFIQRGIIWLFAGLAAWNAFQTLQYVRGILTPSRNTWSFLRCQSLKWYPDPKCISLLYQEAPDKIVSLDDISMEEYDTFTIYHQEWPAGEPGYKSGWEFSTPGFNYYYLDLAKADHHVYVVEARILCRDSLPRTLLGVGYLESRGRMLLYQAYPFSETIRHGDTVHCSMGFVIGENFTPDDKVRFYLWNRMRIPLYLISLRVVLAVPRSAPMYVIH